MKKNKKLVLTTLLVSGLLIGGTSIVACDDTSEEGGGNEEGEVETSTYSVTYIANNDPEGVTVNFAQSLSVISGSTRTEFNSGSRVYMAINNLDTTSYSVSKVTVEATSGEFVEVSTETDSEMYYFTMPESNVTVTITWAAATQYTVTASITGEDALNASGADIYFRSESDVSAGNWDMEPRTGSFKEGDTVYVEVYSFDMDVYDCDYPTYSLDSGDSGTCEYVGYYGVGGYRFSFTMPAGKVTVSINFYELPQPTVYNSDVSKAVATYVSSLDLSSVSNDLLSLLGSESVKEESLKRTSLTVNTWEGSGSVTSGAYTIDTSITLVLELNDYKFNSDETLSATGTVTLDLDATLNITFGSDYLTSGLTVNGTLNSLTLTNASLTLNSTSDLTLNGVSLSLSGIKLGLVSSTGEVSSIGVGANVTLTEEGYNAFLNGTIDATNIASYISSITNTTATVNEGTSVVPSEGSLTFSYTEEGFDAITCTIDDVGELYKSLDLLPLSQFGYEYFEYYTSYKILNDLNFLLQGHDVVYGNEYIYYQFAYDEDGNILGYYDYSWHQADDSFEFYTEDTIVDSEDGVHDESIHTTEIDGYTITDWTYLEQYEYGYVTLELNLNDYHYIDDSVDYTATGIVDITFEGSIDIDHDSGSAQFTLGAWDIEANNLTLGTSIGEEDVDETIDSLSLNGYFTDLYLVSELAGVDTYASFEVLDEGETGDYENINITDFYISDYGINYTAFDINEGSITYKGTTIDDINVILDQYDFILG